MKADLWGAKAPYRRPFGLIARLITGMAPPYGKQ